MGGVAAFGLNAVFVAVAPRVGTQIPSPSSKPGLLTVLPSVRRRVGLVGSLVNTMAFRPVLPGPVTGLVGTLGKKRPRPTRPL